MRICAGVAALLLGHLPSSVVAQPSTPSSETTAVRGVSDAPESDDTPVANDWASPSATGPGIDAGREGALPSAAWNSLMNQEVILVLHEGSTATGRLLSHDVTTATIVLADGSVTPVPKSAIAQVKLASGPAQPPPPAPTATPAPPATEPSAPTVPTSPGWAKAAGIAGVIAGAAVLILGTTSAALAATTDDNIPPTALGGVATVTFGVMGPVVASGARSARRFGDVHGSRGSRIAGWVLYGLGMGNAVVAVSLGAADLEVPTGLIVALTLVGTTSLTLFSVDAFVSAKQAHRTAKASRVRQHRWILPSLHVLKQGDTRTGVFGLVGRF